MARDPWTWKAGPPADHARLRYEPGSWGDVVKGVWAVAAARALADREGRGALRVLDPFAGAPEYRPAAAATARLDALAAAPAGADPLVATFLSLARGPVLPSTGRLARAASFAAGAPATLEVFDLDPARRQAWAAIEGATPLELASGEEALGRPADLVLLDPYDLAAAWSSLRPSLAGRLRGGDDALLLLYLYNRAPRGAAALRAYRALRDELEGALGGRGLLVGRVPSDAVLPRAWHEVLLAGPRAALAPLATPLRNSTVALAAHVAEGGVFEARSLDP
jgi:hypothetical protein